ncbi:sialate O-acetylesterase [Pedobacter sp. AW31-3R]|uniref:sialate O-acetylesterase n=1 Tax=Pedobacter sp. AW31-3R TaxID=3445781 RepID=UPI003FA0B5A8
MNKLKYVLILGFGVVLGIIANRNREYLINAQFIRDYWHFRPALKDKNEIVKSDRVMVCLTIGQSNAANFGDGTYVCKNPVYNYYKGDLYMAKEPILGANGPGCSVWTRVADQLIDSGLYKKVIIVPCAIGSTSVQCWAEGDCKEKLLETLAYLKKDNIKLTHVLWDQGETDNVDKTTKEQYKQRLKQVISMIHEQQPQATFFASITSYFPVNNENPFGISPEITGAQYEVIAELKGVKHGPNTDSLNLAYYRQQDVHFTVKGLNKLAYEWYQKIKADQ